jgi:hypothetical protein
VLCSWSGWSAATAVIELLMMGGKTPETCWVVNKRQDNKLENCCIWLVIYLNCTKKHGLTNLKFTTVTSVENYVFTYITGHVFKLHYIFWLRLLTIRLKWFLRIFVSCAFSANLHSAYVFALNVYSFGVPEDRTVVWWTSWAWTLVPRNALE